MRRAAKTDDNQQAIVNRRGANNPNFKNAGWHTCRTCSKRFHSYNKTRKFCSMSCRSRAPEGLARLPSMLVLSVAAKKAAPRREPVRLSLVCGRCAQTFVAFNGRRKFCDGCVNERRREATKRWNDSKGHTSAPNFECRQCGKPFHAHKKGRLYCSYQCHLDSGGAFRAGLASAAATMRYGPKRDANHHEIFDELRKHCAVYDLSAKGGGLPDGIAWIDEAWRLFDVKNPKTGYGKRGLNEVQTKWVKQWKGGPVYLIYTSDEAKRFGCGQFDGIKKVGGES